MSVDFTPEEQIIEKMKELSAEMRKKRARCSQYCSVWNCEDKDCEIYGDYHYSPSKCRHFLRQAVDNA